ncbi:MAG: ROK family protein, partial [Erysipelothrix sp.]|nr:ROK family protein [Erysipelothrix sp.]
MTLKITSIRQHNKTSVLKHIINNQPISRATVSNETGLNKATVSEITKELLDEKIVQETGIGESTLQGGRKPIMLTFNHRAGMSIGIDIGVNSIRIMSTYLNGEIITQEKMNYKTNELFSTIKHILKTEYSKSKKLPYGVVGA